MAAAGAGAGAGAGGNYVNGMPENMINERGTRLLSMSIPESQAYAFTLVNFLNKKITEQPFLELLRRSVTSMTARWLYYPRAFKEDNAPNNEPAPDYGQIFRFFMKGTSAAAILASNTNQLPFTFMRQRENAGTRKNAYRTTIGDLDFILVINPTIDYYDYVLIRSLLIVRLIESLQEFMSSPMAEYLGQTYDDPASNTHIITSSVGAYHIKDDGYVLQKTIYNSATPIRAVPPTCPFYYIYNNNLTVKGVKTGFSLLKILARGSNEEIIDIAIPSHETEDILNNWAHSDWIVNYRVDALGRQLTIPIIHPQYLIYEFDYAIDRNTREEKVERRRDAKKIMLDLLIEDDFVEEMEFNNAE